MVDGKHQSFASIMDLSISSEKHRLPKHHIYQGCPSRRKTILFRNTKTNTTPSLTLSYACGKPTHELLSQYGTPRCQIQPQLGKQFAATSLQTHITTSNLRWSALKSN